VATSATAPGNRPPWAGESAYKKAGARFLIFEDIYTLVKDRIQVGKRAYVNLRGKSGRYRLYEVRDLNLTELISP
jgi:hypothetical protein